MEESSRSEEEEDNQVAGATLPSSSRIQRNQAEKLRRDKLNTFINELAILVPMVASSAKKLDKTSVLRLSATFLRMHHTLFPSNKYDSRDLAIPMEWCKTLLDGLEAMLLVVTSSRKIVYVSDNVERILGHHQNDLLGSDLKDITHKEDEAILNKNLEPHLMYGSSSNIDSSNNRRSFLLRLAHRPATRSDQPQYEMVRVEGHLRIPKREPTQSKSKTHAFERYLKAHLSVANYGDSKGETGTNTNDVVLVALVRPYKDPGGITGNCVLEATKEEWYSRHLIDGTIVYADHRISVLSGYMSEEVTGSSAFMYMHKEDARWVMIALRQMFCTNESMGWSCYRLKAKNGEYIYMKTQGYLELESDSTGSYGLGAAKSFLCINSLLSAIEGEKLMNEMKNMFTPLVKKKTDPLVVAGRSSNDILPLPVAKTEPLFNENVNLHPLETDNPGELSSAINLLLCDLNQVTARPPSPHKRDQDYAKVEVVSKALPPVEVQTVKIGAKFPVLQGKYNRPSVITSITGSIERLKRPQDVIEDTEANKRIRSENRSVIVSETRSVIKRHEPELEGTYMLKTDNILLNAGSTSFSNISDDDSLMKLPEDNFDLWELQESDLEDGVLRGHLHLENRIQSQGVQIQEIEEDLQTVPLSEYKVYRHITDLKAEHRKQQELLKTLQHDHQNIHQAKDQLLRGAEQDIGA